MMKLWPFKLCRIPSALFGGSRVGGQLLLSSTVYHSIYWKISKLLKLISEKPLDLNDMKFGRVVENAIFYNISKVWTIGD